jgi:putative hemolysin
MDTEFQQNRKQAATNSGVRILNRDTGKLSYQARFAESTDDLIAVQKLRFNVFNLELNEGLTESYLTGLDADPFDTVCNHLIVEETFSREIVGTYRMQTGQNAEKNLGYYSSQEFDFTPYEPFRKTLVELGRACVHKNHRNLIVISVLWKGIAEYCQKNNCRHLIGCSSIPTIDETIGARMYSDLYRLHIAETTWLTTPLPSYRCSLDSMATTPMKTPRLLNAYLSLGAKICGPPAIDRKFGTIDFLTTFDVNQLKSSKHVSRG